MEVKIRRKRGEAGEAWARWGVVMHAINVDYHRVGLGLFDCGRLVSEPMPESPANDQADSGIRNGSTCTRRPLPRSSESVEDTI